MVLCRLCFSIEGWIFPRWIVYWCENWNSLLLILCYSETISGWSLESSNNKSTNEGYPCSVPPCCFGLLLFFQRLRMQTLNWSYVHWWHQQGLPHLPESRLGKRKRCHCRPRVHEILRTIGRRLLGLHLLDRTSQQLASHGLLIIIPYHHQLPPNFIIYHKKITFDLDWRNLFFSKVFSLTFPY